MSENQRRRGMRTRGYNDALAGRQPARDDPEYMAAFLRGRARAAAIRQPADPIPLPTGELLSRAALKGD